MLLTDYKIFDSYHFIIIMVIIIFKGCMCAYFTVHYWSSNLKIDCCNNNLFDTDKKVIPLHNKLVKPRRCPDGTIITLKCLDYMNLSRCSSYIIVHTVKYIWRRFISIVKRRRKIKNDRVNFSPPDLLNYLRHWRWENEPILNILIVIILQ